jgi:hypothetical protein
MGVERVGLSGSASTARSRIDEDLPDLGSTDISEVDVWDCARLAAHFSHRAVSTLDGTSSSGSLAPQESQ